MFLFITLLIIYYVSYRLYRYLFPTPNINPNGKYVLISGCDTGLGYELALELDQQGFNVLAGVYLENNVDILKNKLSKKATVFRLDITKQEDIDAAFKLVQDKTNTLHGLVNNAGICAGSFIDWTPLELMRKVMDVNFFGHVTMTKTFLPLLIAKRDSRIVNICSISGYISLPGTSAYSASKYALESFSDCLRREMFPWGLHVSIIEPGPMQTPLLKGQADNLKNLWNALSPDVQERWGMDILNRLVEQVTNSPIITNADNPNKVVQVIQHAIMNTNPRIRYRPGHQSKLMFFIYSITSTWLQDKLTAMVSNLPVKT